MKICPICGYEYSDEAEFCAKCKVVLVKKPEPAPTVPTNYKRLFLMIFYTFAFIGFVGLLYFILANMLLK